MKKIIILIMVLVTGVFADGIKLNNTGDVHNITNLRIKYLSLADKYSKQYSQTKEMKKLIAANHYYKLYRNFSENGTIEKRAIDFINAHKDKLEKFRFSSDKALWASVVPYKTIVYRGDKKEECTNILQNAQQFTYIKPVFDLASKNPDEMPYLAYKKKCPNLFPMNGSPATAETRDYQRIYSIDIDKDGKNEVIMQINRYSFTPSSSIKTIFDFYIADFDTCKKEQIVSRYYGDAGIYNEGFAQLNGDIYYYEKDFLDEHKNLSLPNRVIKIINTKPPRGDIEKEKQHLGLSCTFDLLKRKLTLCFNYEDKDFMDQQKKEYIDECTEFYKNFLKDER